MILDRFRGGGLGGGSVFGRNQNLRGNFRLGASELQIKPVALGLVVWPRPLI